MPTVAAPPPPLPPPPVRPRPAYQLWYLRQSRVARITLALLALVVLDSLLALLHLFAGLAILLNILALPLVVLGTLILFWRWFTRRFLWSVRNRLTLSYLLMGLAPVVLFSSLGLIALYLFAGQYATNAALGDLDAATRVVAGEAESTGMSAQHLISGSGAPSSVSVARLLKGRWQPLTTGTPDPLAQAQEPSPAWLDHSFRGIIERDGKLYLGAADVASTPNGPAEIFGSKPLDETALSGVAHGLGVLRIYSNDQAEDSEEHGVHVHREGVSSSPPARIDVHSQISLKGGTLPGAANLLDAPIFFTAPMPIYSWSTGSKLSALLVVTSRPTLLYGRLFATSTTGGNLVRIALLSIAITFAVLELLAVLMAIAVSRNIVRAVHELYRGTCAIDAGDLTHRVRVSRDDQLGDLARSFNGMAGSIADLLVQQREKDKLLNELSIAQEVQRTLFPQSPATSAGLELHAVCIPALSVGGDYYDFIFGAGNAVCLTLGDISGKGMSAALLMASLHSSIRALSFDGPQSSSQTGNQVSPGALMEAINRSLYRSTQSSRYATLFAACYSAANRELTYSNGGHLPPMVISSGGQVRRLDEGGPVVGLLPGMAYSEAKLTLDQGDLLVAFTDGVTEPEQDKQEFGEARLLALIQPIASAPLPTIVSTVLEAVKQWIGENEQPDDITLLLARQL